MCRCFGAKNIFIRPKSPVLWDEKKSRTYKIPINFFKFEAQKNPRRTIREFLKAGQVVF